MLFGIVNVAPQDSGALVLIRAHLGSDALGYVVAGTRASRDASGSFMGTTLVLPSTVRQKKDVVEAEIQSIAASVRASKPAADVLVAWNQFVSTWEVFNHRPEGFWTAGSEMDQAEAWEKKAATWQKLLANRGVRMIGPEIETADKPLDLSTIFKWSAAVAGVFAIGYALTAASKFKPEGGARMPRALREARETHGERELISFKPLGLRLTKHARQTG